LGRPRAPRDPQRLTIPFDGVTIPDGKEPFVFFRARVDWERVGGYRTHMLGVALNGKMILYSPVALGDHLTERKYLDAYRNMLAALDHGCLYVWYPHIFHMHKAPTAYMYPFTPIEIHSGYVIGEERIVTRRSGYFGWGDESGFTPIVFDREGKPTDAIEIPRVMRDGKAFAEVRLPEDCLAILVRAKSS